MAGLKDIPSVWNNIKEIDLKPIRDSATRLLRIALVGAAGAGRHTLAAQMRTDPSKPEVHSQSTLVITTLDGASQTLNTDLIILMVDASRVDFIEEKEITRKWSESGKNVLLFFNKTDLTDGNISEEARQGWMAGKVIFGSGNQIESLQKVFIPAVLELLPQQHIALGRQYPLFRKTIAHQLINDTCFSNSAYSVSTGVAEIIPVLDLPLNLTDIIVLTKSQAFLAYKLGLLLGFSTRWQDYVTEFGGVIGGGFIWRQIARSLIGLVPGWGIIPKVAVAYSGTYVVGNAILGWYESGRNLSPNQMRDLSKQAFNRGKEFAKMLGEKFPRGKTGKQHKKQAQASLNLLSNTSNPSDYNISPSPQPINVNSDEIVIEKKPGHPSEVLHPAQVKNINSKTRILSPAKKLWRKPIITRRDTPRENKDRMQDPIVSDHICSNCGKKSSGDAVFCQYCGLPL